MAFPFAPVWLVALASVGAITNKEATEAAGGQFTTEIPAQLGPYHVKWTPNERLLHQFQPEIHVQCSRSAMLCSSADAC